jgi:hypothetical protein
MNLATSPQNPPVVLDEQAVQQIEREQRGERKMQVETKADQDCQDCD